MRPLIQKLPSKLSVDSSDQNFAKVPIFYKKAHIVSEKLRLTEFCGKNANGEVISERLNNKPILCKHLVHAFLTIIHDRESLGVYKKIMVKKDIDTEEFAPNETVLDNQFYNQISVSGYYANIQDFSVLIKSIFNQGEINSIRKYVFCAIDHAMAMIMKKTAYNKGWIIGYDPNLTFECIIFHIENIIQKDNTSPLQSTTENPWDKIKQFMVSDWKELYFSEYQTMALLNFNTTYHYSGCHIKSKLSWKFQSFGVNNLQQLKNILQSGEGLYFAMQHGHIQSVRTFLNQLKKYCQLTPLSNSEIMIVIDILFSKRERNECSGLLIACQKEYIKIVKVFLLLLEILVIVIQNSKKAA